MNSKILMHGGKYLSWPSWVLYYPEEPGKFLIFLDKEDAAFAFIVKKKSHPKRKTLLAYKLITFGEVSEKR